MGYAYAADRTIDTKRKTAHDRDENASKNILGEGLREYTTVGTTGIACGEDVRPSDRKEGKPQ